MAASRFSSNWTMLPISSNHSRSAISKLRFCGIDGQTPDPGRETHETLAISRKPRSSPTEALGASWARTRPKDHHKGRNRTKRPSSESSAAVEETRPSERFRNARRPRVVVRSAGPADGDERVRESVLPPVLRQQGVPTVPRRFHRCSVCVAFFGGFST